MNYMAKKLSLPRASALLAMGAVAGVISVPALWKAVDLVSQSEHSRLTEKARPIATEDDFKLAQVNGMTCKVGGVVDYLPSEVTREDAFKNGCYVMKPTFQPKW